MERNRLRDQAVTEGLELAGWEVVRLWEHVPPEEGAALIASALRRRPTQ
jgi:DNA mismatch endonuclease (patch repair protein)